MAFISAGPRLAVAEQPIQVVEPALEAGEGAVELGLEAAVEDRPELGAGLEPALDQVAAEDERRRPVVGQLQGPRPLQDPGRGLVVGRQRRPAAGVGPGHPSQAVDPADLVGQAPHRGVGGLGVEELARLEVMTDQGHHLVGERRLARHPLEERARRRLSRRLVAERADAAVLVRRGARLAEVVAEAGQADHQVLPGVVHALARERVHDVEGVGPDIALGMPLRVLAGSRSRLRAPGSGSPIRSARRNARPREIFLPLSRSLRHSSNTRSGARPSKGMVRHSSRVSGAALELEARHQLHAAQHAQRVLDEALRGVAQQPPLEVAAAAEGVLELVASRGRSTSR